MHSPAQLFAAVSAVGEDRLQKGKEPAGVAVQDQKGAVAILQVGRMDGDGKDQAEGVDEEMTLLAFDFLARVVARRFDVRPPFPSRRLLATRARPEERTAEAGPSG